MNNPHAGEIPFFSDRFQTIFFQEGHSTAIVVTRVKTKMREKTLPMPNAEAALAWAKKHQAGLYYLPAVASAGN
jgi:hypothetical protein